MNIKLMMLIMLFPISLFSQWETQQLPSGSGLGNSISIHNSKRGVVCGYFIDFYIHARSSFTTNGGLNWSSSIFPDSVITFNSVDFADSVNVYISGNTSNRAFFGKSTNSGKEWLDKTSNPVMEYLSMDEIDFIDIQNGICIVTMASKQNKILKTTNSGLDWFEVYPKTTGINSIIYSDNKHIFASVSSKDVAYTLATSDGGISWKITLIENVKINDLTFIDNLNGLLIGENNDGLSSLYKTIDGGDRWDLSETFFENYYFGIEFNSGVGLMYGIRIFFGNPVIVLSTNSGNNWLQQKLPATPELILNDAVILDSLEMFVAGGDVFSGSTVLHTSSGGYTFMNENVSSIDNFNLLQNYPNPFNPVTNINFSIPGSSHIILKVFNNLGQEVETLVNESLNAGSYQITWNAVNYTSGLYYYSIQSKEFVQTKKMLLIK